MAETKAYEKLMADPVWGPECRILSELRESARSRPAVVGGAVRDLLLGRPITDLDIATASSGTAGELAAAFAKATERKLIEYTHEQTIYRVVARDDPQVDFTDPIGGTREADLVRRDFSINALALGLVGEEKGRLVDPTGGAKDIASKVIRMSSEGVFDDDPLRLIRAFRFSSQLGFEIEDNTLETIHLMAVRLRDVAGERLQMELVEILASDGVAAQIESMDSVGLLRMLFPELVRQKGLEQNEYHHLDVWEHTLDGLRQIERVLNLDDDILRPYSDRIREYLDFTHPSGHSRRALIKLAMLLHDIAKPHCRVEQTDGRITFIGHERKGADLVGEHMIRLKFPTYERDFICTLIEGHLRPMLMRQDDRERPRVAFRFFRDYEDSSLAIILLSLADRLAAQGVRVTDDVNQMHRDTMAYLLDCLFNRTEIVVRPPQLVDGGTLIHELGLEPGPMIGHLLRRVQEAQVMGEVTTREGALEYCRGIVRE